MQPELLRARWQSVKAHIEKVALTYQRNPEDIQLVAVSKFHPSDAIACLAQTGQFAFGENYVQEMLDKASTLKDSRIEWHFIGPLQSNKCKEVATTAYMMHSLDRIKLVEPLARYRPLNMAPLKVLLQVNIDDENNKSGVHGFDELLMLAKAVMAQERLELCGLMTIPAPRCDFLTQSIPFRQLHRLREQLQDVLGSALPELSMGMSADSEAAIAEGATIVRIGTDIFGSRSIKLND
jgi:pyridoxal phosphate enzyme (YggS family)